MKKPRRVSWAAIGRAILGLMAVSLACRPTTARPFFPPVTGAAQAELGIEQKSATEALAEVLRSDSLPVTMVALRDGYIETAWFDARSKRIWHGRKLGQEAVQIRAWVDPTRTGYSKLTVETVYRPLADASLDPRELDHQVPEEHPVGKRVTEIVTELAKLYSPEPHPTGP